MWSYEKRLQFPVNITRTCPKTAAGSSSASTAGRTENSPPRSGICPSATPCRSSPWAGLLTDIGTEELAHMEMICAMVYQLTKNLTPEQAKAEGFDAYYIDHTTGLWPQAATGLPFSAVEFQSKGDAVTDLTENLAAEQKARVVYENLLRVIREPDVREPLKFLRAREIVHFQRFGEALERTKEKLDAKNFYYFNPEFDKQKLM